MIRVLSHVGLIQAEIHDHRNVRIIYKDAIFKRDFGVWVAGQKSVKLIHDLYKGTIEEYDNTDILIAAQQVVLVTKHREAQALIEWMNDDVENEHLYTKEGIKVYRLYDNSKLVKTIKEIVEEISDEKTSV